eukprot:10372839-Alexandrium_andersonii.AAC.1
MMRAYVFVSKHMCSCVNVILHDCVPLCMRAHVPASCLPAESCARPAGACLHAKAVSADDQ